MSVADLANLYFAGQPPDRDFYITVFENLEKLVVTEESTADLIHAMRRNRVLQELSLKSYELTQGKGTFEEVIGLTQQLNVIDEETVEEEEDVFVTSDLGSLLESTYLTQGLRWRLGVLNRMMGSLRKGDFGFILARPETGKTTFLVCEETFMAAQLPEDEYVLHFNNEEQGEKVMLRAYQAALGLSSQQLTAGWRENYETYKVITGDRLKIIDNSEITKTQIERICERYKPGLIVFDQIDKIKGFPTDLREDLRLGEIYRWARELAKKYAPVIGVTQADGNGEGQRWLTMGHVANAKTSKQAEADWILGIGKDSNPGMDSIRYLHLSKNKLTGDEDTDPTLRHGREQVVFEPIIARYRDIVRTN